MKISEVTMEEIYTWLEEVRDPEIPVLSVVDLGVITNVEVEGNVIRVEMTPTFVGCPALEFMKSEIVAALKKHGEYRPEVTVSFKKPWSSDLISVKGKAALKKFGLAPPPATSSIHADLDILEHAICPRCSGTNTSMKSPFGPTLCRSLHYCFDCKEAFEQFKPL